MQAVAKWLVARPQNAVMGLAVTLLLPAPQLTSGVIMVLLVLGQGTKLALLEAAIAAAVLLAVSLLFSVSIASVVVLMAGTWLPVLLLAVLLLSSRSLTLTMQVSVIIAAVAMIGFYIVVVDPVAFWQPYVTQMAELVAQNNLQLNTELLSAEVMTISAVLAFWMLYTAGLLLGYALYRRLPQDTGDFGWFRDLDFGRVIAFTMAITSLLAFVVDATWLQNLAFVLFVIFWIQGLAIVHWMHVNGQLPLAAVIAVYALLPFLQVLLMTALAVLGYTDAWFGFRRRRKKA
ncbi:MAG: hypothetical protein KJO95_01860 [Gammaproteobacteria bacterium]|nr:hypothetical protein [Gammaproteobacteria bacterium]MBU2677286.1 hypothetical protein [Gammaproteobacteria bacterium]NNC58150.1 hypothetical protein [Woeseiaceae bacterium]NNL51017.1 hypothetical protein [Woeseiaceae bacterium]